jgi:hypothetical protein
MQNNVIAWDSASLNCCATALDDAHAALRVHAPTSAQLRAAADVTAWTATMVHNWPPLGQVDDRPPFPAEPPTAEHLPEVRLAAASFRAAAESLDICSGHATTALQGLLARLETWCSTAGGTVVATTGSPS